MLVLGRERSGVLGIEAGVAGLRRESVAWEEGGKVLSTGGDATVKVWKPEGLA